jgi:hypothetical protein
VPTAGPLDAIAPPRGASRARAPPALG